MTCHSIPHNDKSVYSGYILYDCTDSFGKAHVNAPVDWILSEDSSVRLRMGNPAFPESLRYAASLSELADVLTQQEPKRMLVAATLRANVSSNVPDEVRHAITAAGWPRIPTQEEAQRALDAAFQRVAEQVRKDTEIRQGGQRLDSGVPRNVAPVPLPDEVLVNNQDGKRRVGIRVRSWGYGAIEDDDVEKIITGRLGGELVYIADALAEGYVGTVTGGALQELCYVLDGVKRYMYLLLHSGGDTWYQEWWVSPHRLTASAAATVIEACREIVNKDLQDYWRNSRPVMPPSEGTHD